MTEPEVHGVRTHITTGAGPDGGVGCGSVHSQPTRCFSWAEPAAGYCYSSGRRRAYSAGRKHTQRNNTPLIVGRPRSELFGYSELGREVTLTLSVVSLLEVATGTVEFVIPKEGFQIVSGDTSWAGSLKANVEGKFTLVVKALSTGDWTVSATFRRHGSGGQFSGGSGTLYVSIGESAATATSTRPGGPRGNIEAPAIRATERPPRVPTPTPTSGEPQSRSNGQTAGAGGCTGGVVSISGGWLDECLDATPG